MNDTAIRVQNLGKLYQIGQGYHHTLRETLTRAMSVPFRAFTSSLNGCNALKSETEAAMREQWSDSIWALRDVSFEIKKGETVGIIGPNGSGKSTLLKLLAQITEPTTGEIRINGRVTALIELGAGFHPELTGKENIYLNGAILGMTKAEIEAKFEEIVDFAGLPDFIETPVKHYSSGMYLRLGFAAAAHSDPDVLIVDEGLAVGDAIFVKKCFAAFEQFQKQGVTILFVSHDMNAIRRHCHEAIWLDDGALIKRGEPKDIIDLYNGMIFERLAAKAAHERNPSAKEFVARKSADPTRRFGTAAAEVLTASLLNSRLNPVDVVTSGEETNFRIEVQFNEFVNGAVFGMTIRDKRGTEVYGTNTLWKYKTVPPCKPGDVAAIVFKQKLMLGRGEYSVNIAVNEMRAEGLVRLDWVADVISFSVTQPEEFLGFCNLDSDILIQFI